jgi:anti-anti-sigma factor
MKVKIDTKEKFNVLVIEEANLSANMTEELKELLLSFLNNENKNVILKLGMVETIDDPSAKKILDIQQTFYDNKASFVICEMKKEVEDFLDKQEFLDLLNITPTESEAWDIVQMEEIEREFLT